ncbi:MAG: AAA family ATPase [Alphaproteobacteria bacterium]|nr:AAA family ATPase [Alphaproteobacteria bacterium]
MTCLSPQNNCFFVGHEEIEKQFLRDFREGKLSHGYIFYGEKGIGKETFGYRLARFLMQENRSLQSESLSVSEGDSIIRKVSEDTAWNFFRVEPDPEKKTQIIDVKQIRALKEIFTKKAEKEDYRVVLIHPADRLNRQASNALLKLLEEPPEKTLFLLITSDHDSLLPTIRSRCRLVRFSRLSDSEVAEALTKQGIPVTQKEILSAQGSPGKACQIIEHKDLIYDLSHLSSETLMATHKKIIQEDAIAFAFDFFIQQLQEKQSVHKIEFLQKQWEDYCQFDLDKSTFVLLMLHEGLDVN